MPSQYDAINELYEEVKRTPIGLAETATVRAALPDLTGKTVLDVGCGAGFYPRLFRQNGATRVVAVDESSEMIAHARYLEEQDPLGISYDVVNAAALPRFGTFDVVTSIWLVGYAENEEQLDTMLSRMIANLRPGGDLIVLLPNPDADWEIFADYAHYGLHVTKVDGTTDRTRVTVHVDVDPPFEFESFVWAPGVAESALERAGLVDIRRQPVALPSDAVAERGEEFWQTLRDMPTFAVYRARRA